MDTEKLRILLRVAESGSAGTCGCAGLSPTRRWG